MKKRVLLTLMCVTCISFASMAQLTTGNSTATVVRSGNRASMGDFGVYFGMTSDLFRNMRDPEVKMVFMPLVNFKYMQSDNLELRLGIELDKTKEFEKGALETGADETTDVKIKTVNAKHTIYPGLAYHFSNTNLLDVYIGAELPLGYIRDKNYEEFDGSNSYQNTTRMSYHVGLGGFIGLQAYIANLPLAIGVEWGISSMLDLGLKQKVEFKADADSNVQTVYTSDLRGLDPTKTSIYESFNARRGEVGNQFRVTLTYFFKQ